MPRSDTDARTIEHALADVDLVEATAMVRRLGAPEIVNVLDRLNLNQRAIIYRLLSKEQALEVFENLDPSLQGDLVGALQDDDVGALFADLNPDDRVELLDELPASVARRLLPI
jgi:magnesium transporter